MKREVAGIGSVVAHHAVAHHPVAHTVDIALEDRARPLDFHFRNAQACEVRKRFHPHAQALHARHHQLVDEAALEMAIPRTSTMDAMRA